MEPQTPTPVSSGGSPPPATAPEAGGDPTRPAGSPPASSWRDSITDESLRGHQGLTKFKDVDSLAKSYVELDKLRNERSGVKPLTAESTPDEIAAYRQAMGVPEAPEKYELGELGFPDDFAPTQESLAQWQKVFHTAHMNNDQVKAVMEAYAYQMSQGQEALEDERRAEAAATDTWGKGKFGGAMWEEVKKIVNKHIAKQFGQEGVTIGGWKKGEASTVWNHPALVELIYQNAKLTGHDTWVPADGRGMPMDQATAFTKYNELLTKFRATQDENERATLQAEMAKYAPRAFGA
jgi:hypothetical protein